MCQIEIESNYSKRETIERERDTSLFQGKDVNSNEQCGHFCCSQSRDRNEDDHNGISLGLRLFLKKQKPRNCKFVI